MESSSGNVDPKESKDFSANWVSNCEFYPSEKKVEDCTHFTCLDEMMHFLSEDLCEDETLYPQNHDGKNKAKRNNITSENIIAAMSRKIALTDAAKEFDVSRSTLKRRLKELGFPDWPSSRKYKSLEAKKRKDNTKLHIINSYSDLLSMNPTDPTLAGNKAVIHTTGKVNQTVMTTESLMDGHRHDQEHMDGPSSTLNTAEPEDCDDTFIVKARFNEDVVKFDFSLSSSIDQLREEVSKRLELEKGNFKIKYQDEERDWILICSDCELKCAVRMARSLGSNVVRLLVTAK